MFWFCATIREQIYNRTVALTTNANWWIMVRSDFVDWMTAATAANLRRHWLSKLLRIFFCCFCCRWYFTRNGVHHQDETILSKRAKNTHKSSSSLVKTSLLGSVVGRVRFFSFLLLQHANKLNSVCESNGTIEARVSSLNNGERIRKRSLWPNVKLAMRISHNVYRSSAATSTLRTWREEGGGNRKRLLRKFPLLDWTGNTC